jgi:endonuclease/exonuclease/phosphatase family metal-dependent hydrolase
MTRRHALSRTLAAALLMISIAACAQAAREADTVTLATWNAEWLIEPATFDELARVCIGRGGRAGGDQRTIPCDLVPARRWTDGDLDRLRDFAATVEADVVALQEVDGPAAAARLFPGWSFCFTSRRHVQNVGFAVRPGLPHRCNPDYRELGLPENDVRWGADLSLYPDQPQEVRLLAVHLKSGCNRDPLTADSDNCRVLQDQVPVLEAWIDARAEEGVPFAVLGDFNRRFDREFAPGRDGRGQIVAMWPEIDDGQPPEADLVNPDDERPTEACRQQDPVRPAIDHILLSASLGRAIVPGSYRMWTYPRGGTGARWPDHCIRSVRIEVPPGGH